MTMIARHGKGARAAHAFLLVLLLCGLGADAAAQQRRAPPAQGAPAQGAPAQGGPTQGAPVPSIEGGGADAYAQCMDLARRNGEAGFEAASIWAGRGGGLPARHCAAVALMTLGQPAEAASRLETLAQEARGSYAALRPDLLAVAAQGWLAAGEAPRAHAALSTALTLRPGDPDLLIDRAVVLAGARNYWEAIDDLNRAVEAAPRRVEALVLRATAYRYVDSAELAAEDIGRALALAPGDPDALLERGNLRRLRGDTAGARRDWLAVLERAPDSPAAAAARDNIERMDLRVEPDRPRR